MKYGNMNIMQFLEDKNLFINICKFQSSKEACIGFLSGRHPSATLESDLQENIDQYLQEGTLALEESTTLTQESSKDKNKMEYKKKVLVPEYDIVSMKVGFGNGKERIDTNAIEIRCDPKDTIILKKLVYYSCQHECFK